MTADLHTRVVKCIDEWQRGATPIPTRALITGLRQLVAMHHPFQPGEDDSCPWCQERYPCQTSLAIAAACGVSTDG